MLSRRVLNRTLVYHIKREEASPGNNQKGLLEGKPTVQLNRTLGFPEHELLQCKRGHDCLMNSPGGQSCDFITSPRAKYGQGLVFCLPFRQLFASNWGKSAHFDQKKHDQFWSSFLFLPFPFFCLKMAKRCCFWRAKRQKSKQKTRPPPQTCISVRPCSTH